MVLLVSYLEYTYQNDCLSKMNVRKKKGMVALAFCINLYSVCIISDTTGNQVCLVINTKKKRAGKNKIKYYQEAAIKSLFLTAARLLSSLALPELTSVFFAQLTVIYNIYVSHECSRILHCPK